MLLDTLQHFEWLNEPANLNYNEAGMEILTAPQTDFWQHKQHHISKDNGHFFYCRQDGNFSSVVHWSFKDSGGFRQCGLMLRLDDRNWIKAGLMSADSDQPQIGTVVTAGGYSDWATTSTPEISNEIWFKVKRLNGDYLLFYSADGQVYKQLRMLHFQSEYPEIKVGAYACSPQNQSFLCTLRAIEFI